MQRVANYIIVEQRETGANNHFEKDVSNVEAYQRLKTRKEVWNPVRQT